MKKTETLTLMNVDKSANLVAQDELRGIYNILQSKLNDRLEACYEEEDDEGHKMFFEPPDMKWYMKELRDTANTILKLNTKREEVAARGTIDIIRIMQEQAKMTTEEREELRRKYVIIEP